MRRAPLLLLPLALLAGCDTVQSITGGDGRHTELFNGLFAAFIVVTGLVYLAVLAFLAVAMFRRQGKSRDGLADDGESREGPLGTVLIGWVALISLILGGLAVASWLGDRRLAQASASPALDIEIVANQWWWDVRYMSHDPSRIIRTANELHLPVGVPVHITLKSNDVIHSFWVPNLAGKQDLIPGRINDVVLRPLRVGVYRGQCAEFCGLQHAHMALDVTVESPSAFAAWQQRQGTLPPPPTTPLARAGYNYVTSRECAACHNIAGTPASGQVAPDLTHVASRRSIGAGTYPMNRGHLYAWIADPQSAKPGNNMPVIGLEPAELHAIVAYLETLQ
ncbi:MAG TPA: cytochrome c oxidase subunit II [Allosphingosinicella sp.]|nr:cytochrome c oxidase subunit II [Allosphingosinicella sp.]